MSFDGRDYAILYPIGCKIAVFLPFCKAGTEVRKTRHYLARLTPYTLKK